MSAINVQFSVAVHVMAVLGDKYGEEVTTSILADSVKAHDSFVRRVVSKLSKGGLVVATRGKNGFCTLTRRPNQISLLDIYKVSEAPTPFAIHSYPEERQCRISRNIKRCMTQILEDSQRALEKSLKRRLLSDLIDEMRAAA
jgi:Rrf2 family protein